MLSLPCGILKKQAELIDTEKRLVVAQRQGVGRGKTGAKEKKSTRAVCPCPVCTLKVQSGENGSPKGSVVSSHHSGGHGAMRT